MATNTTNYSLVKPELTDAADITAMNPNWDKIDTELKGRALSSHSHIAADLPTIPINKGGTNATTAAGARTNLGVLPVASPVATGIVGVKNNSSDTRGAVVNTASGTGASLIDITDVSNSSSNRSGIKIANDSDGIDKLGQLFRVVDGTTTWYRLYGEHNKPSADNVIAGTFAGKVKANASAISDVAAPQLRDIKCSTTDLTAGSSALASGVLHFVYE